MTNPSDPADPWATPAETPEPASAPPTGAPSTAPYATPAYGQQPPPAQPPAHGQPPPYGQAPYGPPPPYAQGGYGYAQPRSTNGFAIASLVLGILWIYWIGSILALVFGYVARNQIRSRNQQGDGMAIAGIVLGWIGVGILLLLIVFGVAVGTGVSR